jgi:general stress protein 26
MNSIDVEAEPPGNGNIQFPRINLLSGRRGRLFTIFHANCIRVRRGDHMSEKNDHDTHYEELTGEAGYKKIYELIKGIRIAMLSTIGTDGMMSSRPMAIQDEPFDGTLWFLTRSTSEKVDEIQDDRHVMLTFAEPKNSKYIALKGIASVSRDRTKIKELWNSLYKAWFPKGEDDPEIAVLKVAITEADFWEASDSRIILGMKYLAAAVTGGKLPVGEAGHIDV